MKRNEFIKSSVIAGLALMTGSRASAENFSAKDKKAGTPFNMNFAPHANMFSNNGGKEFLDQIKYMYDQGFHSIEDNGMASRPEADQEKIGNLLAELKMSMGVFVLQKGGNGANTLAANKTEYIDIFLKGCHQAVEVSKRCGGKLTTVVPGDFDRRLTIGIQTANVIEALRRGAEILEPHNITMVLEPLSDTPDLFLRTSDQTFMICKAVNSPSCKILYDIYHMQRNEGNLIANIEKSWDEIAYFQIGDNPGRKEPTTGEINYKNVFKYIHEKGYKGILGMEHGIAGKGIEGELALIKAYREVDISL